MSDSTNERSTGRDERRPFATAGDASVDDETAPPASATPAGQPPGQPLPLDVVFGILKNRRRRLVLWYLEEVSATSTLSELAEHVAAIENDKPVEALSSSERKRVYVGLYQGHLPRLDEAGVVEFDDDRGTVAAAENAPQLTRYLQFERGHRGDRSRVFLAVAALGGGLFVAQQLLVPSPIASALVIAGLLGSILCLALDGRSLPVGGAGRRSTQPSEDSV